MNKLRDNPKEFVVVGAVPTAAPVQTAPARAAAPDIPISFDRWWLATQSKYKFKPSLKSAVRKHFEARGFMDYKKFNAGLRDFGFNV
jgi:hypothetical protein